MALGRILATGPIHLIIDSTGLSIVGEGEWAAVKHGRRGTRGWKKLHLGVDGSGVVVAHALTGGHVDDATTALDLLGNVDGNVRCLESRRFPLHASRRVQTLVMQPDGTLATSGIGAPNGSYVRRDAR